jgi:molybdopterin-guanine dinucleotide biosynthesis protein A
MIAGAIIAGGRSQRFGGDKAAALLAGRTLLEHVTDKLRIVAVHIVVNAPPNSQAAALGARMGLALAPDAPGDPEGPLSGLKAALSWAESQGAALLATAPCDTPLLPRELYPRLREEIGEAAVAIAETADGPHALCGLWRVSALPALARTLAGGRHPPVRDALAAFGVRRVRFSDPALFANVNTPDDLERAEALL